MSETLTQTNEQGANIKDMTKIKLKNNRPKLLSEWEF